MIIGLGIDAVEIKRFDTWSQKSVTQLQRIFSKQEIAYCLSSPIQTSERFAVRFAAREAAYKAIAPLTSAPIPFLRFCKAITITNQEIGDDMRIPGAPRLTINWDHFESHIWLYPPETLTVHISMTHTSATAIATVIIEKA